MLWAGMVAGLAAVTAVSPWVGKAGAAFSYIPVLVVLSVAGTAFCGRRFDRAVQVHRCGDARLPGSRATTFLLILVVVLAGALVMGVLVGVLVLVLNAIGPRVGDVGAVVLGLLVPPGLAAAMVGLYVLALRSARLTALFVKLSHPAPWA